MKGDYDFDLKFQPFKMARAASSSIKKGPRHFHTPVSSTRQFKTKGPLLFSTKNPLIQHKKASVQHQKTVRPKQKLIS